MAAVCTILLTVLWAVPKLRSSIGESVPTIESLEPDVPEETFPSLINVETVASNDVPEEELLVIRARGTDYMPGEEIHLTASDYINILSQDDKIRELTYRWQGEEISADLEQTIVMDYSIPINDPQLLEISAVLNNGSTRSFSYSIVIEPYGISIEASLCGQRLKEIYHEVGVLNPSPYEVVGGETIDFTATSPITEIQYMYYVARRNNRTPDEDPNYMEGKIIGNHGSISLPKWHSGAIESILIHARSDEYTKVTNPTLSTGWFLYRVIYTEKSVTAVISSKDEKTAGIELQGDRLYQIKVGETLKIQAEPENSVVQIYYAWGDNELKELASNSAFTFQEEFIGYKNKLKIVVLYTDGLCHDDKDLEHTVPLEYQIEIIE